MCVCIERTWSAHEKCTGVGGDSEGVSLSSFVLLAHSTLQLAVKVSPCTLACALGLVRPASTFVFFQAQYTKERVSCFRATEERRRFARSGEH